MSAPGRPRNARDREVAGALAGTALPPELAELVARAAASPELSRRERRAVARELAAHLEDGLAAGRSVAELRRRFGDPERAAALIGRARRGLPGTLAVAARAGAACAVLCLAVYCASAARLRWERPARAAGAGAVEAVATVADADRAGRARLADLRAALAAGDEDGAARAAAGVVRVADALSRQGPWARLAAAALVRELALVGAGAGGPGPAPVAIPPDLRGRVAALEMDAVASWLDDFLARVYSGPGGGGRLTAEGLRLVRGLKGSREAPPRALLLEPVFFLRPAGGPAVRAEADRLVALARDALEGDREALAALETRLTGLSAGGPGGLGGARYYPLTLALARLPGAVAGVMDARAADPTPSGTGSGPGGG